MGEPPIYTLDQIQETLGTDFWVTSFVWSYEEVVPGTIKTVFRIDAMWRGDRISLTAVDPEGLLDALANTKEPDGE